VVADRERKLRPRDEHAVWIHRKDLRKPRLEAKSIVDRDPRNTNARIPDLRQFAGAFAPITGIV
jgi:hypothetical protein